VHAGAAVAAQTIDVAEQIDQTGEDAPGYALDANIDTDPLLPSRQLLTPQEQSEDRSLVDVVDETLQYGEGQVRQEALDTVRAKLQEHGGRYRESVGDFLDANWEEGGAEFAATDGPAKRDWHGTAGHNREHSSVPHVDAYRQLAPWLKVAAEHVPDAASEAVAEVIAQVDTFDAVEFTAATMINDPTIDLEDQQTGVRLQGTEADFEDMKACGQQLAKAVAYDSVQYCTDTDALHQLAESDFMQQLGTNGPQLVLTAEITRRYIAEDPASKDAALEWFASMHTKDVPDEVSDLRHTEKALRAVPEILDVLARDHPQHAVHLYGRAGVALHRIPVGERTASHTAQLARIESFLRQRTDVRSVLYSPEAQGLYDKFMATR
jgi:hypothetical protein